MRSISVGKNLIGPKITTRTGCLNNYLKEVSEIKIFKNAQEEYDCALKCFNGDEKAKTELVSKNLRFVISVAKQFEGQNAPLEDLINEGNIGLIEAAGKFDPTKGFKFISYAIWYIRKNINDYIKSKSKTIRIPVNNINALAALRKEVNKIEQENSTSASIHDVKDKIGDTRVENVDILIYVDSINVKSISSPIGNEDDVTLENTIEGDGNKNIDNFIREESFKTVVDDILGVLTPKQKMVIVNYYGLNGSQQLTTNQLSSILGITTEGVRQLKNKAIMVLKNKCIQEGINTDIFGI